MRAVQANLCTRILEKDRHCQAVREVRALANHMAGDMAAFEKVRLAGLTGPLLRW